MVRYLFGETGGVASFWECGFYLLVLYEGRD